MTAQHPVFVPLTPFNEDFEIDESAFIDQLEYLQEIGAEKIVVNGSGSEFGSLSFSEKVLLAKLAREHFRGECTVHISSSSYKEVKHLASECRPYADSFLLLPPYYRKNVPEKGVITFFKTVLADLDTPVYLYSNPHVGAGLELSEKMVKKLCGLSDLIAGIMYSSFDEKWIKTLRKSLPDFEIYLGGGTSLASAKDLKAQGVVTIYPGRAKLLLDIRDALQRGEKEKLLALIKEEQRIKERLKKVRSTLIFAKEELRAALPSFPTALRPPLF